MRTRSRQPALWLIGLVLSTGCDRVTDIRLPDPSPDADLGFGVLYDGDAVDLVGPLARRQAFYAGRYTLNGGGGLTGRLYFVNTDDLVAATENACDALTTAADRLFCREQLAACAEDPTVCWLARESAEGCGDRLVIDATVLPMIGYEPSPSSGRLEASAPTPAPGVAICGPQTELGCPNRRPGYIVTESGRFGCVADTRQVGCAIEVDLSRCGESVLRATLDESGALTDPEATRCTVATSGDTAPGLPSPADLTLDCGEGDAARRLSLRAQETLLASTQCPSPGPPIFEAALYTTGQIIDGLHISTDTSDQLLLNGEGWDECAHHGCALKNQGSCQRNCNESCNQNFFLRTCARDSWAACVDDTEARACQARCEEFCLSSQSAPCEESIEGTFLALTQSDRPRVDTARRRLSSAGAASGTPSLADLSNGWYAAVSLRWVKLFEISAGQLVQRGLDGSTFDIAGVVRSGPDALAWFGSDSGGAIVRTAQVRKGTSATFEQLTSLSLSGFEGVNAAALGGARGDWLVLARTSPRLTSMPWNQLRVVELGTNRELSGVTLPAPPTAIVALPQGRVLVAHQDADAASALTILEPGTERLNAGASFELPPGLTIRALALDPLSCGGDAPSACRILMGIETETAGRPALLGAAHWSARAPGDLTVVAALRPLETQLVSRLIMDRTRPRAWAVAGFRNRMTPLDLEP